MSDLNEHDGEDNIRDGPDTVGSESGFLSGDEETRTIEEGRLAVLSDQDLIVCLDSIEESGESLGELVTNEDVLRTLPSEDQA